MNILISSCLLGEEVRYDGNHNKIDDIQSILSSHTIFSFCPEVEGGLSTPRIPAEIVDNRVLTKIQEDVTEAFKKGAQKALEICIRNNIKVALLKAKSPSCGNTKIYDGSFSGKLIDGQGMTAKLLLQNDITVFNEYEILKLSEYLKQ